MREGKKRYVDLQIHSTYRNPDAFGMFLSGTHLAHCLTLLGMYTYNDHYGYGLAEMIENLVSSVVRHLMSSADGLFLAS